MATFARVTDTDQEVWVLNMNAIVRMKELASSWQVQLNTGEELLLTSEEAEKLFSKMTQVIGRLAK